MQIDLTEEMQEALEKAAEAAQMSVTQYANMLLKEQLTRDFETAKERNNAIDKLIEHMKNSTSNSGRNDRGWREFIHEGHTV